MKMFAAGLLITGFALFLTAPAFAATATVKGQVIDQECYLMEKKVDSDKSCAVSCAKEGKPLALLTSDGKVYQITGGLAANKNAKLVPHVLHTVEITGDVTNSGGKLSIASDAVKMIK
jgi:hypothetical protein